MSTAAQVAAYEHEARLIPGLPENIQYLEDDPAIASGLMAKIENGVPIIQGAPSYTVTRRIALHELGHLWHMSHRDRQDAFWAARFGGCASAPASWAQAKADSSNPYKWLVDPGESIAECFAIAIEGGGKERTLDYGCTADAQVLRAFFGYVAPTFNLAIDWLPSPNFWHGRPLPIKYIVLHTTQGTDSRGWLTNPASQVSAHYLVRGPRVYQLVDEADSSWHAGSILGTPTTPLYTPGVNPNHESIGIEMEGLAATLLDADTLNTTAALITDIRERRGDLPLVNHSELSPGNRSDPGAHNRAAVEERLGVEDMTPEQDTRLRNVEAMLMALQQQQTSLVASSLPTWLQRAFFALNPITGKRQGKELMPPNLEVQ